jgi:hypothetical protein
MGDFSHTREWWPAVMVDEGMPAGRARPEDWLSPDADGVTKIRDPETADDTLFATIRPGDTIGFVWHESRGAIDILLMPDGSWSIPDQRDPYTLDLFAGKSPVPPPPMADIAGANWFAWDEDYESNCGTMDEFARCFADLEPPEEDGRRVTVEMGYWSDHVAFRVSADGRSLEKVDA